MAERDDRVFFIPFTPEYGDETWYAGEVEGGLGYTIATVVDAKAHRAAEAKRRRLERIAQIYAGAIEAYENARKRRSVGK